MNLRTGVDLIEISRIEEALSRHGEHFLGRVFTDAEQVLCQKRFEALAGRFAAKEAVAKALGCGIGEVGWKEIEILDDQHHAPVLNLHGNAINKANELGLSNWSVSLSHSKRYTIAFVVATS